MLVHYELLELSHIHLFLLKNIIELYGGLKNGVYVLKPVFKHKRDYSPELIVPDAEYA